jgi:hypothetical protein
VSSTLSSVQRPGLAGTNRHGSGAASPEKRLWRPSLELAQRLASPPRL